MGVSFVTIPSLWRCSDLIFFAADLVCTMVVGEKVITFYGGRVRGHAPTHSANQNYLSLSRQPDLLVASRPPHCSICWSKDVLQLEFLVLRTMGRGMFDRSISCDHSIPSSLWTCPDSIFFAADLVRVCTMAIGEKGAFQLLTRPFAVKMC